MTWLEDSSTDGSSAARYFATWQQRQSKQEHSNSIFGTIQAVLISYLVKANFIVQSSVVLKSKVNSEAVGRLLHSSS